MNTGACPTCGKEFKSKTAKTFCCMKCYIESPQFKAARIKGQALASKAPRVDFRCLRCGADKIGRGRKQGRKFCSKKCYREHYAERFDRFIANPETPTDIQGFDEFLAREELECPFDGCGWKGKSLGMHVNLKHGVTAESFKEMAGFNKNTGLVGVSVKIGLAAKIADRVAADNFAPLRLAGVAENPEKGNGRGAGGKWRKEGLEHWRKSRADKCGD